MLMILIESLLKSLHTYQPLDRVLSLALRSDRYLFLIYSLLWIPEILPRISTIVDEITIHIIAEGDARAMVRDKETR